MTDLNPATIVLILAVGGFTAVASIWDIRWRRIPNWLTLPMFGAGVIFQTVISFLYGWHNFANAAAGFLVGFGVLFVLWFVGGGGGGDVKLMGALSVWLGFRLTLYVMIVGTCFVVFGTIGVVAWSIVAHGMRRTREQYLVTGKARPQGPPPKETIQDKQRRRIMAYATPIALATWTVVLWKLPAVNRMWLPPSAAAAVEPAQQHRERLGR